jgi:hypothetical protein
MKMTVIKKWMQAAKPEEQFDLARRAETTRSYLYHLAGNFRDASPDLAARLEHATAAMHKESGGRLPRLYRTDLNESCRKCEFAQKCLGSKAVASDFDFIPTDPTATGQNN